MFVIVVMVLMTFGAVQTVFGEKVRALGGYERLLSRLTPGTNSLSLSHASAVVLNKKVAHKVLLQAVTYTLETQPILRSYIDRPKTGDLTWNYCEKASFELAKDIVTTVSVPDLSEGWQRMMQESLNNAKFNEKGPLWRLYNLKSSSTEKGAWVFCLNHGADDQGSVHSMIRDLVTSCNAIISTTLSSSESILGEPKEFPPSMEDAMVQGAQIPLPKTLGWALFQMCNSLRFPATVPLHIAGDKNKKEDAQFRDPDQRETFCEFLHLPGDVVTSLRALGRDRGVTLTSVLSAAMLSITSAGIQSQGRKGKREENLQENIRNIPLRFLLSVDLRPYGSEEDTLQLFDFEESILSLSTSI